MLVSVCECECVSVLVSVCECECVSVLVSVCECECVGVLVSVCECECVGVLVSVCECVGVLVSVCERECVGVLVSVCECECVGVLLSVHVQDMGLSFCLSNCLRGKLASTVSRWDANCCGNWLCALCINLKIQTCVHVYLLIGQQDTSVHISTRQRPWRAYQCARSVGSWRDV